MDVTLILNLQNKSPEIFTKYFTDLLSLLPNACSSYLGRQVGSQVGFYTKNNLVNFSEFLSTRLLKQMGGQMDVLAVVVDLKKILGPKQELGNNSSYQCDQIGLFITLWATFQSPWQQLFCPNCQHIQAIFVNLSKSFILLATFIEIWQIFTGRTASYRQIH